MSLTSALYGEGRPSQPPPFGRTWLTIDLLSLSITMTFGAYGWQDQSARLCASRLLNLVLVRIDWSG